MTAVTITTAKAFAILRGDSTAVSGMKERFGHNLAPGEDILLSTGAKLTRNFNGEWILHGYTNGGLDVLPFLKPGNKIIQYACFIPWGDWAGNTVITNFHFPKLPKGLALERRLISWYFEDSWGDRFLAKKRN